MCSLDPSWSTLDVSVEVLALPKMGVLRFLHEAVNVLMLNLQANAFSVFVANVPSTRAFPGGGILTPALEG